MPNQKSKAQVATVNDSSRLTLQLCAPDAATVKISDDMTYRATEATPSLSAMFHSSFLSASAIGGAQ